jgi:hypothetical protein
MKGWHFFRILRLILGCIIIGQAFIVKDIMFGILGLLFSLMAIFDINGCGVGACSISQQRKNSNTTDIKYEEIK